MVTPVTSFAYLAKRSFSACLALPTSSRKLASPSKAVSFSNSMASSYHLSPMALVIRLESARLALPRKRR